MTKRRILSIGAALSLAAGLVLTAVTPAAALLPPGDWCSDDPAPPCIFFASRDGIEVDSANTTYDVYVSGADDMLWAVQKNSDYDLGSGEAPHAWVVTIDTGTVAPRVAHQYANDVTVTRFDDGDGTYRVRVVGNPVDFLNNDDCDTSVWPWTCPHTATSESTILQGSVTNYSVWTDVEQRKAMDGMNYSTNIEVTSIPPEITYDGATGDYYLLIRMANSHFHPDGSTVFTGFAHLRIPNQFLRVAYGVDDPTTMTSASLTTSGAGLAASTSITQESGDDAMLVDITGITFSRHLVKIKRGVITPTRPTGLSTKRATKHRAKVLFTKAKARGSKITGYKVRCESSRGAHTRRATGTGSPVVVTDLKAGRAYDCRVRAKSKAGLGTRSTKVHVAKSPPPGLPSTG